MIRIAWRQFRTEAATGLAFLAIVAVILAATGPQPRRPLPRCAPSGRLSRRQLAARPQGPTARLARARGPLLRRAAGSSRARVRDVPIGLDPEHYRSRWVVVKFGLVGLASSLLAGGLSLMGAWWADPISIATRDHFSPKAFGQPHPASSRSNTARGDRHSVPRRRHLPTREPLLAFQAYETALFVLLALALAGISLWWVRHRLA